MSEENFTPTDTFIASEARLAKTLARPVKRFLDVEASGGILLMIATAVALIWANSPWSDSYDSLWGTEISIELGDWLHLVEPLSAWVNDALMAIFFFVVGMEIKRELTVGELKDPRKAALPAIGAVGGMVVPALLYAAFNAGGDGSAGWGIPMATDIAFALGVVALLGDRVPPSLKVYLLTLAIVDDLGAIAVIAVFYTEQISVGWGAAALGLIALTVVLRRLRVWYLPVYLILGVMLWVAVFESGVHATIAGVVLGVITPTRALRDDADGKRIGSILSKDGPLGVGDVDEAVFTIRETVAVNDRLTHFLHPWSSYVIIPIFALANAGIALSGDAISNAATSPVTLGVVAGLVVGKTAGVGGFAWLASRSGLCEKPAGATTAQMFGISAMAGIGFTVSLFVTSLAFEGGHGHGGEEGEIAAGEQLAAPLAEEGLSEERSAEIADEAKIGILFASAIAAIGGAALLATGPEKSDEEVAADVAAGSAPPD